MAEVINMGGLMFGGVSGVKFLHFKPIREFRDGFGILLERSDCFLRSGLT